MLEKIDALLKNFSNDKIFGDFYFIGGTALAYYLNHRISYDIDFISTKALTPEVLKAFAVRYDANFIPDVNESVFRINTGDDLKKYKMMFSFDGIKVEFFYPNDPVREEIVQKYKSDAREIVEGIKILPLEAIARLKLLALFRRNKIRDLFDVYVLMQKNILDITTIERFCALEYKKTFVEFIEEFKDDATESLDFESDSVFYGRFQNLSLEERLAYLKSEVISIFIIKSLEGS